MEHRHIIVIQFVTNVFKQHIKEQCQDPETHLVTPQSISTQLKSAFTYMCIWLYTFHYVALENHNQAVWGFHHGPP